MIERFFNTRVLKKYKVQSERLQCTAITNLSTTLLLLFFFFTSTGPHKSQKIPYTQSLKRAGSWFLFKSGTSLHISFKFLLLLCQLRISFISIPFLYIYIYIYCSSFTFPAEIKLSTEKCRKLFAANSSYLWTFVFPISIVAEISGNFHFYC